jgi:hypothetical protein
VTRFAAHKALWVTKTVDSIRTDRDGNPLDRAGRIAAAEAVLHTADRYQAAEARAASMRARVAKQWGEFGTAENRELYPNIRWIASTATTPREEHMQYWGMVLPKDDPFWATSQPGNLWGCVCGWEETAMPPTGSSAEAPQIPAARGLEGNPGVDGTIFTERASYYQQVTPAGSRACVAAMQRAMFDDARETLKDKAVRKQAGNRDIDVRFTRKGLEHIRSDRFPDPLLRDMLLADLDRIVEKAVYVESAGDRKGNPMVLQYHYYRIELFGKEYYLNVRETANSGCYLYALTGAGKGQFES